jgi:hypothetical protein
MHNLGPKTVPSRKAKACIAAGTGGLYPKALQGRRCLYSCRHRSVNTFPCNTVSKISLPMQFALAYGPHSGGCECSRQTWREFRRLHSAGVSSKQQIMHPDIDR